MIEKTRSGWGRTSFSKNLIFSSKDFQKVKKRDLGISGLPVGLGRSYGDSSLNSSGILWTCNDNNEIKIDVASSIATCGAGSTIGELEREASRFGFFPPVVPGTEFVSIGGAIASDVHGKSHHSFGSFGDQLVEIQLLDSQGNLNILRPVGESSEIFWATVGGMGLTGIILSAKIKLIPIQTTFINCKEVRVNNLSEALEIIKVFDKDFLYTVAWIDFSGNYHGRGLVSGGNHINSSETKLLKSEKFFVEKVPRKILLPDIFPSNFINPLTVRLFNELWYRKPLKTGVVHFQKFLHPLDSILNWNRIYGSSGLIQYQFQVPEIHEEFLFTVLKKFKAINAASFLVVLKRFGPSNRGLLSFPKAGWTMAVDLPANLKGLEQCMNELDSELVALGGRVYLTKDQRLSKENFQEMYPENQEWKRIKQKVDPENYWQSDQGRRLGLC